MQNQFQSRVVTGQKARIGKLQWMLHVAWDMVHHLYGQAILPYVPLSSLGCAICDTGIAIWYFLGAPSVWKTAGKASATHLQTRIIPEDLVWDGVRAFI